MNITRIEPGKRLSEATVHNGTVYLAGQIAADTAADMYGQTVQVLASIDKLLAAAGSSKSHMLSCTLYVTDMRLFPEMNRAWDAWVDAAALPARATVEAKLATPAHLVEIQVIAALAK